MIESAEEFISLRTSKIPEEHDRATHDIADISTWMEVIKRYPEYKQWVVHNKTVPIEILDILAWDTDATIRSAVARKNRINDQIFIALARDKDENVRYALMCNTKLDEEKLKQIDISDSEWLAAKLREQLARLRA